MPELSAGAPAAEPAGGGDSASRGAISQLQEFVQRAKNFPMPPNCPVLQWDCDTRMSGTSLEFRATVAFLLDGVPHHTVGVWKPSKKAAQRDAAERALGLYVERWGSLAAAIENEGGVVGAVGAPGQAGREKQQWAQYWEKEKEAGGAPVSPDTPVSGDTRPGSESEDDAVELLRDFCCKLSLHSETPPPEFVHTRDSDGRCQSFVQLRLLGVSHTFSGQPCGCKEVADADVARRVLWYLQCPGMEDAFEPDHAFVQAAAQTIPVPSASWTKGDRGGEGKQLAERKTAVMRVQNRLQQAFARQLEAGISVWSWTYERDQQDQCFPPLFRATASVPLAEQTFVGNWVRGQREAQIDTCGQIVEFLDARFPRDPRNR